MSENLQNPTPGMSATVASIYSVIADLVRLAARYLKLGDSRSSDVLEELEELSEREGVGLDNYQVQFNVRELIQRDLRTKFLGMSEGEVARFVPEEQDEDDCQEVHLEIWKVARDSHIKTGYIGQLFSVRIPWGQFAIQLNVLAARDEYVQKEDSIVTVETGDGLAYLVTQFTWGTFRIFAEDEEQDVSPAKKLMYLAILDKEAFGHVDVEMFAQWSTKDVLDIMDSHRSGMKFSRFSAEEAGLIVYDRNYDEEEALLQSPGGGRDGNVQEDLVNVERINEEESIMGSSSNVNNNDEEEKRKTYNTGEVDTEFHVFDGRNRTGEKVVLTTDQMRKMMSLMIWEVSPEKTEEQVKEAVRKVNWKEAVANTNGCLARSRAMGGGMYEEHEETEGREMWSSEDEEGENLSTAYDVSGISSLPNLTSSSLVGGSGVSSDDWSPVRRIRSVMSSEGRKEEEPEAKRIRRLNNTSALNSSSSFLEPTHFSPILVKPMDERHVITVSTSSSTPMDVSDAQARWTPGGASSHPQFVDDIMLMNTTDQDPIEGAKNDVFLGVEEDRAV